MLLAGSATQKLVNQATTDNLTPTPTYLYDEISKVTFEGTKQSSKLVECMVTKLQKNSSPNVLLKVLKAMRFTCDKGHVDFKKELQRHVELLRSYAQWRGKVDEIHGDELNQRVRDEAHATIEAAFTYTKPEVNKAKDLTSTSSKDKYKEHIEGGCLPKRSSWADTPLTDSSVAALWSKVRTITKNGLETGKDALGDGLWKIGLIRPRPQGEFAIPKIPPCVGDVAPDFQVSTSTDFPLPTGNWGLEETATPDPAVGRETEYQLVQDTTTKKKQTSLTRQELRTFVDGVPSGKHLVVAELLNENLKHTVDRTVRMRTLCILEYLMSSDFEHMQEILDFFKSTSTNLVEQTKTTQASVRERANKVCSLVGLSVGGRGRSNTANSSSLATGFTKNHPWFSPDQQQQTTSTNNTTPSLSTTHTSTSSVEPSSPPSPDGRRRGLSYSHSLQRSPALFEGGDSDTTGEPTSTPTTTQEKEAIAALQLQMAQQMAQMQAQQAFIMQQLATMSQIAQHSQPTSLATQAAASSVATETGTSETQALPQDLVEAPLSPLDSQPIPTTRQPQVQAIDMATLQQQMLQLAAVLPQQQGDQQTLDPSLLQQQMLLMTQMQALQHQQASGSLPVQPTTTTTTTTPAPTEHDDEGLRLLGDEQPQTAPTSTYTLKELEDLLEDDAPQASAAPHTEEEEHAEVTVEDATDEEEL